MAELRIREVIGGATIVHHADESEAVYLTCGREIVRVHDGEGVTLGRFPRSYPRDLFNFHRLAQRAARGDKCNVYVNREGRVLGVRASTVYAVDGGNLRRIGRINGDCVLHDGFAEDQLGWTYFGEYFRNPERLAVRIWRTDPALSALEVAREFPAGQIRHVHGIFADPYDDRALWASVGDLRNECYLIRTGDRFASMTWFGDGTQKWRAVKLFFTPTHVTWITDSHLEQNFACRMDRRTGALEIGQEVDCSGWYGTTTRSGHFLAGTTVERGPAIKSKHASLLFSDDGFHWQVAHRFRKDRYPMRFFKYGVINFPSGSMELGDLYLSGEGLVELDGRVIRASLILT